MKGNETGLQVYNFLYQPEALRSRLTGVWEHQSQLGTSVAMALQVHPGLLIGAEARYMRSYEGLAPNTFTGNALFLGPTFYARLSERAWVSAAWNAQVAGQKLRQLRWTEAGLAAEKFPTIVTGK